MRALASHKGGLDPGTCSEIELRGLLSWFSGFSLTKKIYNPNSKSILICNKDSAIYNRMDRLEENK